MAEVLTVTKLARLHVAWIKNFDSATDEVIVVKKDAARVWIESEGDSQFMFRKRPEWTGQEWSAAGDIEVINMPLGICDDECVEFVAVKTHRPPVAQEVTEPVLVDVDEQYKSVVLAVYPNAKIEPTRNANTWFVSDGLAGRQLSSHEPAQFMAWRAAAVRLRDTKPETTALPEPVATSAIEHLGCGVEVVSGAVPAN